MRLIDRFQLTQLVKFFIIVRTETPITLGGPRPPPPHQKKKKN